MDENYEELSTGKLNAYIVCSFLVAKKSYLLCVLKDLQKADKWCSL